MGKERKSGGKEGKGMRSVQEGGRNGEK